MMTPAERHLWRHLAEMPMPRGHFRRQAPIGPYIVDFANHTLRIVIEVDGDQHGQEKGVRADLVRDGWLRSQGYTVLRFWNADVLREMEGVMSEIARHLPDGSSPPPPAPPHKGEGRRDRRRKPSSPSPSMGEGRRDRRRKPSSPSPSMGEGRGGGDLSGPGEPGTHERGGDA